MSTQKSTWTPEEARAMVELMNALDGQIGFEIPSQQTSDA